MTDTSLVYRLVGRNADNELSLVLRPGNQTIGSGTRADLYVGDSTVSRRHAAIDVGRRIVVRDLGSKNGTAIDGRRVSDGELREGGRLELGGLSLILERVDPRDTELAVAFDKEDESDGDSMVTIEAGPVASFALFHLPGVLQKLLDRAPVTLVAQQIGESLLSTRLADTVEIVQRRPGQPHAVLFTSQPEWDLESTDSSVRVRYGVLDIHAKAKQHQDVLAQFLDSCVQLLALADGSDSPESAPEPRLAAAPPLPEPATVDPGTRQLYAQGARVAPSHIGIMICGESGTGKEVFARYVHAASSRSQAPLVCVNCAALPRDLLESELFGIEKGVATGVDSRPGIFEQADGGTVFLDEIGDMPLETQALLLRVLQEKEVVRIGGRRPRSAEVRVLAATNRDLDELLETGRFREDLYYRIATWIARLPSLRERTGDLPNLAAYFVQREAERLQQGVAGISRGAIDALLAYDWPGNIRQLELEMARAVAFVPSGGIVDSSSLSPEILAGPTRAQTTLEEHLEQVERREILRALDLHGQDVNAAANALGISRATLYRKIKARAIELST
ncbi:MAG: sigma 54-interacting transcriptional regulator [Acidobacteriota bacterium]